MSGFRGTAESRDGDVQEGFLCPICMQNLGGPAQLIAHFQDQHQDEPDVLRSLKDLFGIAKKKITQLSTLDEPSGAYSLGSPQTSQYPSSKSQSSSRDPPQALGATRSHSAKFRMMRNSRMERYCAETNKLLIRLDKLVIDVPGDLSKRKAHEQNVVCWVDDTYVNLCPSCARGFHVARRKHHCRLCGGIMCHDCSFFLTMSDARRMTAATSLDDPSVVRHSGSSQSLQTDGQSDPELRLCGPCYERLNQRELLKQARTSHPIISQFYEKLQSYKDEAISLLATYHKMCLSLCSGESLYHLSDAQILRVKLIKLGEAIDNTSKAILVLGTKAGEPNAPKGRALRLQQAVRSSATHFIRDKLMGLPSLPTEDRLKQLQEKHQREIENRMFSSPSTASSRTPQVVANSGWGPTSGKLLLDTDNVMVQQMNNLKNYIKQAREAHRYDEVHMLEANLRELQEEYWNQQQI